AAVGVTSRAIYRHFPSKHAVLAAAVSDRMTRLEALVADAQSPGQLIDRVAELMVDTRDLGVLVQREARHLDPGPRAELDDRMAGVVRQVARSLPGRRRTAVGNEVAAEMLAVLASPSWHGVTLPPSLARALLRDMAMAIARTEPTVRSRPPVATRSSPASRREVILGAAIGLFAARGYAAVRMEDVGASVGIAGPSIYEHFAGKADLLMTALTRGAEWLQLGMARALDGAVTAEHALAAVARSYVEF